MQYGTGEATCELAYRRRETKTRPRHVHATVPGQRGAAKQRMETRLINIGFRNMVSAKRIVAVVGPDSAPVKRIVQEARERGQLIDGTYGRRTRAVIVTDSNHVLLAAVQPETIAQRVSGKESNTTESTG